MTSYLQNLSFELYNGMKFPSSSSGIFFLILPLFVLFLGSLIYIFQSRLIYLPQLPPGSRQEVWLPSRFGYGPGKRAITNNDEENHKKDDDCCTDDQCTWEELIIDTPDGEKLQAYWIVAPSKWSQKAETETENEITKRKGKLIDDSSSSGEPYTILYMQANAGNIVSNKNLLKCVFYPHCIYFRDTVFQLQGNCKKVLIVMFYFFLTEDTENQVGYPQSEELKLIHK